MSRRLSWRVRLQDTGLPLVVLVQRSLLILIAIFYLVGQAAVAWAGAAWEWNAASPFWLSGFLLLIGAGLILGGPRLATLIGLLCIVFLAGNRSMQQRTSPTCPTSRNTTCASLPCHKRSYLKAGCSRSRIGVLDGDDYTLKSRRCGKMGVHAQ